MSGPRLVATVARHGWGHLAQTVPIVGALRRRIPGLTVTVRTGLDAAIVRARFEAAGQPAPDVDRDDTEFGLVMRDALSIDADASIARYRALLDDRDRLLARERDALRALRADVVLSNIGWLPIAAARANGVPAFGACSLNWADILEGCWPQRADVAPVVEWMAAGYARADALFALEPGMPFDRFGNRVRIAPIARRGVRRRDALARLLGAPDARRLVLVAFGGLPLRVDTRGWRLPAGWHAVVFADGAADGPQVSAGEGLGWSFQDLLASVDLLVAKPGYGTFAEAGFAGRDTLVVPRDDWPEAPYLDRWLERHARTGVLALEDLRAGRLAPAARALEPLAARPPADGDGAAEIAEAIARRLGVPPPVSPPGTGGRTVG